MANLESNDVSVLLNNGNGTFATASSYPAGDAPFSVALGDLDGDHDLDLAVANSNSDDVSVLMNNGDGTFATSITYGVDSEPKSVAIGDLDGDLDLDLAVASRYDFDVSILLNNGDGTFPTESTCGVRSGRSPVAVAIGDLDGDHNLDLAVANNSSNDVSLLLNEAKGSTTWITPNELIIFRGIQIGGSLEDVFESDDSRIWFNPGLITNSSDAPVWLIFDGNLPDDNPGSLEIVLESQAGTPGLTHTLETWNWTSSAYDVIDVSPASFNNDVVVTVDLSSGISDYAQPGAAAPFVPVSDGARLDSQSTTRGKSVWINWFGSSSNGVKGVRYRFGMLGNFFGRPRAVSLIQSKSFGHCNRPIFVAEEEIAIYDGGEMGPKQVC